MNFKTLNNIHQELMTAALILLFLMIPMVFSAQNDSILSKISFKSDFRFRVEQDWNSQKSDGTFRDDRTRLRYRLRTGVEYADKWYKAGFRIRTGNPNKQQDPQLTLGDGFKEFGTLPIGLEKAYFEGRRNNFNFWLGKNTFPFQKNNELFWSDNVFPEGVFLDKGFETKSDLISHINIGAGHFIMSTRGNSLDEDTYFQGYQVHLKLFNQSLELFPSLYRFRNVPNIPDGGETFEIDYSIFHLGARFKIKPKSKFDVELDYYLNLEDYNQNDSIASAFKDQKTGLTFGLKYGALARKGDWLIKTSYTYLEQYSIVDFMAQNDWARWDYSSFGSPDGRLSNMNGIEIVTGLMIDNRVSLKMKYYLVEQLLPYGTSLENGNRIRLDLDVKF